VTLIAFHRWFRAGVEHCFAQFKKFQILGGRYRGILTKDQGILEDVITIIATVVLLQVTASPLRHHTEFFDDEDDDIIAAHVAEFVPAREAIDGHPIGTHRDIRRLDDGKLVGPGDEPSNRAVNTGFGAADFQEGPFFTLRCAEATAY